MKLLVESGANVNHRDHLGVTALFWATGDIITVHHKASFGSAVYAMVYPSICHTAVLCQNEGMQRDKVFTIG